MAWRAGLAVVFFLVMAGSAASQSPGDYEVAGVSYFRATGDHDNAWLTSGMDYNASALMQTHGCAVTKIRPDKDLGRIRVISSIGQTPFTVEFTQFESPGGDLGGIERDILVDGSRTHPGAIQHPAVPATIAAWGRATAAQGGIPFLDPATGDSDFLATFFITDHGFRDDEDGAVRASDGSAYQPGDAAVRVEGDWEMHLRLESSSGAQAEPTTYSVQRPPPNQIGPIGAPAYFPPTEAYSEVFGFWTERFGGAASLTVQSTSLAPAGENNVQFRLRNPVGDVIEDFTLEPSLGNFASHSVDFPLDEFGAWNIEVLGTVSLSEYRFDVVQMPPDDFDLNFWWENVTFGYDSIAAQVDCEESVDGGLEEVVDPIVARNHPPSYKFVPMVASIVGVTAAFMTAVAFTLMTLAAVRMYNAHRGG